jgi:hypothetical protein
MDDYDAEPLNLAEQLWYFGDYEDEYGDRWTI